MKFFKSLNHTMGLSLGDNKQYELNKIDAKIESSQGSTLASLENNANFFIGTILHLCIHLSGKESYAELTKRRKDMDKIYAFRQLTDTALIEAINSEGNVKQEEWNCAYVVADTAASYERTFFEDKLKSIHYKTSALALILLFSLHTLSDDWLKIIDIPISSVMLLLASTEISLLLAKNDVIPLFHSDTLEEVVSHAEESGIQLN